MTTACAGSLRFLLGFAVLFSTLTSMASAEIQLPKANESFPIRVSGPAAHRWTQGSYEVWVFQEGCEISQGKSKVAGKEAVIWVDRNSPLAEGKNKIIAYVEKVEVSRTDGETTARAKDKKWFERLYTTGEIEVDVPRIQGAPTSKPAIYDRGMTARSPESAGAIRRTQYSEYGVTPVGPPIAITSSGTRRFKVLSRSNVDMNATFHEDPPNSGQWIGQCTGGINLLVEGIDEGVQPGMLPEGMSIGKIDVSADRIVLWTSGIKPGSKGESLQSKEMPLEIYLEGNIVFRQDERIIYAERMYYDVRSQTGVVLEAELLSPLPGYQGLLRMRSKVLQQTGPDTFFAQKSYFTSSRMGKPSYRLELGDVKYEDFKRNGVDPITGAPRVERDPWITGKNSLLYFGDVPVFYWPWLRAPATDPTFYIQRAAFKSDHIFGKQFLTDWDMFELLGMENKPEGLEGGLSLDYMSMRGLGHGATLTYQRNRFFSWPGETAGLTDYWGIYDTGTDNLGRGQRDIPLAVNYRYRGFLQHRQRLPRNWTLSGEFGKLSDRNFLEAYFEREWDELKDETTGLRLEHRVDNCTFSINASARLNPFFTQTQWLPRLDHYWIGEPLLNNKLTWFEHSSVTYADYMVADKPQNLVQEDLFVLLPWETAAKGERLITTQEIDWPVELGAVKAVPYALGQLGHWGEDINGERIDRAYWQGGVRASMPMWRVNPNAESSLWNVHGLAHKIVFDAEFSVAEANKDVRLFPLYDPIDDDSTENFRRRMEYLTFGSPGTPQLPWRYDPRSYAIRSGLASAVTSPSAEIVDDMMAMRMNINQRWQTKRGKPGSRRIIDWMKLDAGGVWFPKADRDDFGKSIGLVSYDYAWHMGDRFTLVSEGIFDFLDEGQNIVTIGGFLNRPPRGNLYLGFRVLEGPIEAKIVSVSYNYWMSPKWVSSFGTSVDLARVGNIGQRFNITRVGESLLFGVGFNVDSSKENVGIMFTIEPRFLPQSRLGQVGGVQLPVAGMRGLE